MEQAVSVLAEGADVACVAAAVGAVGSRAQRRLRVVSDLPGHDGGDAEWSCLERTARMLEEEEARLPAGSFWRVTYGAWISALRAALRLRRGEW